MKLLSLSVLLSVLLVTTSFAQSVDLLLSVTDGVSTPAALHFGLAPQGADTLQKALGEDELPPLPPGGVFDARFIGSDIGVNLGQGTLRDYRQGDSTTAGLRIHEIAYQVGTGASITISWSLPPWVEGRLQDFITGSVIDTAMRGNGSFTVTNPGAIAKLKMTVRYGIALPLVPTLSWPPYGAVGIPVNPAVSWLSAANAASYHLQVSEDSTFAPGGLLVNDSTLTTTAYTLGPLEASTVYFWRVKAKNAGGVSPFSSTWKFKTTLAAPTLTSPANGASGLGTTSTTLSWLAVSEASWYHVQLARDSTLTTLEQDVNVGAVTFLDLVGLEHDQVYYWRVRATNSEVQSAWSPLWHFKTIMTVPAQVALISPTDAASLGADTVRFLWRQGSPRVERYWLEIASDSLFTFHVTDSSLVDTAKIIRNLARGQTYWWKVAAKNAAGRGPFSVVRNFHVPIAGISEKQGLPQQYRLEQNYPNPCNPATVVRYALPQKSSVLLTVYNTLGQKVADLVNNDIDAGYHEVRFNGNGLASGVYFYRLTARSTAGSKGGMEGFVQTRTLLLLK